MCATFMSYNLFLMLLLGHGFKCPKNIKKNALLKNASFIK
jgi:hypothetical protein